MTKTTTVETTEKYDLNGHLVEKIVREETVVDDKSHYPSTTITTTSYNADEADSLSSQ